MINRISVVLIASGIACLALVGVRFGERNWYQWRHSQVSSPTSRPAVSAVLKDGDPAGRIEIPAIGLKAVILEGAEEESLRLGVGHIRGTASLGEDGNVGLSAHRDTFFRRLGELKPGAAIRIASAGGDREYRVTSTEITTPGDVSVLEASLKPELTLVTCYPFRYVGSAPQRYIVHASPLMEADHPPLQLERPIQKASVRKVTHQKIKQKVTRPRKVSPGTVEKRAPRLERVSRVHRVLRKIGLRRT